MKYLLKKLTQNSLAILIMILFCVSCEKGELVFNEKISEESPLIENGNNGFIKKAHINDYKELKSYLKRFENPRSFLKSSTIETSYGFTIIEDSDIYVFSDSESTTFTLPIKKKSESPFGFSNLIIKFSDSESTIATILNYTPSQEYINN